MSTVTLANYDSCEIEDLQQHEKMQRQQRAIMPAHRCRSVIRATHKSPASRRANKHKSSRGGGMQCRRKNRSAW